MERLSVVPHAPVSLIPHSVGRQENAVGIDDRAAAEYSGRPLQRKLRTFRRKHVAPCCRGRKFLQAGEIVKLLRPQRKLSGAGSPVPPSPRSGVVSEKSFFSSSGHSRASFSSCQAIRIGVGPLAEERAADRSEAKLPVIVERCGEAGGQLFQHQRAVPGHEIGDRLEDADRLRAVIAVAQVMAAAPPF